MKLYIDLAIALLVVGLMVTVGFMFDQHKLDKAHMAATDLALTQQQAVTTQLQAGQQASDSAIQAVAASQAAATQHGGVVRQRVVTMGKNDATLQTWLDGRIPGAGRSCLLDDTCPADSVAPAPIGGASAAVH